MNAADDIFAEYKDLESNFGRPISKEDLEGLAAGEPFQFTNASGNGASAATISTDQKNETFQFGLEGVFDDMPSTRGTKRGSDVDLHPSQTGKQWGDKKPRKTLSGIGNGKGKGKDKGRLARGNSKDYQKARNQTLSNYITRLSELLYADSEDSPKSKVEESKSGKQKKSRFRSKAEILRVSRRGRGGESLVLQALAIAPQMTRMPLTIFGPYNFNTQDVVDFVSKAKKVVANMETETKPEAGRSDAVAVAKKACAALNQGQLASMISLVCTENNWKVSFSGVGGTPILLDSLKHTNEVVIYSVNEAGQVTAAEGACCRIFGRGQKELVGRHFAENVPRHERNNAIQCVDRFFHGTRSRSYGRFRRIIRAGDHWERILIEVLCLGRKGRECILMERDVTLQAHETITKATNETQRFLNTFKAIVCGGDSNSASNMHSRNLIPKGGGGGGVEEGESLSLRALSTSSNAGMRALSSSSIWQSDEGITNTLAATGGGQQRQIGGSGVAARVHGGRTPPVGIRGRTTGAVGAKGSASGGGDGSSGIANGLTRGAGQHPPNDFDSVSRRASISSSIFTDHVGDNTELATQGIRKMSLENMRDQHDAIARAREEHERSLGASVRRPSAVDTRRLFLGGVDQDIGFGRSDGHSDMRHLAHSNSGSNLLAMDERRSGVGADGSYRSQRHRSASPALQTPFSPLERHAPTRLKQDS